MKKFLLFLLPLTIFSCQNQDRPKVLQPAVITQKTENDTDDPAIWINRDNPASSLILGTDKGDKNGGIYVFNLDGAIDKAKTVLNLERPNNIDIAYNFSLPEGKTDIAVFTERGRNMIRVFSLPEMKPIDKGGIEVFSGEEFRDPMGIALYTDKNTGNIYAIVSRKFGPTENYLWQYLLTSDSTGNVMGEKVREFGKFSGTKEIEAIAVDNELGYIYYSDETHGVRKYYASPDSMGIELAFFATEGIKSDHEGISVYKLTDSTGYILLSDQQANQFHIFPREGSEGNPHLHPLLKIVKVKAQDSDGSDVTHLPLNETFKRGLFVAMSTDKTFHFYRWEDIAGEDLKIK